MTLDDPTMTAMVKDIKRQIEAMRQRGLSPNGVLFGQKQSDELFMLPGDSVGGRTGVVHARNTSFLGLRVIWTAEPDQVRVVEIRKHAWVF